MFSTLLQPPQQPALPLDPQPLPPQHEPGQSRQGHTQTGRAPEWDDQYGRLAVNLRLVARTLDNVSTFAEQSIVCGWRSSGSL